MNLGQLAIRGGLPSNRHPMIDRERATTEHEWVPSPVEQLRPEVSPTDNPADDSAEAEFSITPEVIARFRAMAASVLAGTAPADVANHAAGIAAEVARRGYPLTPARMQSIADDASRHILQNCKLGDAI
jgi:hypothetical protein